MKRLPIIKIENQTIFLSLDLKGMGLYERGKAIRQFINSDTKVVEDYADTMIRAIFKKYGIYINTHDKSALASLFNALKDKGKTIDIIDFYKNADLSGCEIITRTKSGMTVLLEDNRYIICGVEIKEIDL